ncbi:MAG: hypothetical protein RIK87_17120 [Fuerstiella sp.]
MVLKELMRHASVTTTEKYDVGIDAQETARHLHDVLSAAKGTLGGTPNEKAASGMP